MVWAQIARSRERAIAALRCGRSAECDLRKLFALDILWLGACDKQNKGVGLGLRNL